ncbi:MAG: SPL family radical SAM protein [Bullifex sp.]
MHHVKVKGILSPSGGMNLYRGCQHGCIYCDSRSKVYCMDHDFEDVCVKENAIELLDEALSRKRKPCMIGMGSMCDSYMSLEEREMLTRRALETVLKHGFGCSLITKSASVLRDLDLISEINRRTKCVIQMTLTTADDGLCRIIEPNVSITSERVSALRALRDAGVPTIVWLSPILPFINDTGENISFIIDMCMDAGVMGIICFGMGLTLREGNREYFHDCLDASFPGLREKYERTYGNRYIVSSPGESALMELFHTKCGKYGIMHDNDAIFSYLREFPDPQLSLF